MTLRRRWLLDLQATQSMAHADRGVARYVKDLTRALLRRDVGEALLLNPHLPFPRSLDQDLLASPLLRWATQTNVRSIAESSDDPIGFLLSSPFELSLRAEGDLPVSLLRGDVPVACILYDLIPLVMPDRYLADPILERRYRGRAEQLHGIDVVLTISEHTRRDALRLLDLPPERVHAIGAGVSPFWRPLADGDAPELLLRRHVPAVTKPFVYTVAGGDPRKNTERLFDAWAAQPTDVRASHQLVVTCSVDPATRKRWVAHAGSVGLAEGELVLTGWQPDEVMRALYQRCSLFAFPPLYEGYGLPLAEAIACGAPAVTSGTSSMPEVLDLPDATFDPADVDAMAALVARGLADSSFRSQLVAQGAARRPALTWDAVAERAVRALARVPDSDGPTTLPVRVALVGPMPPTESGIADYNARLVPALARRAEVDLFTPGAPPPGEVAPGVRWLPPRALKETCSPWGYDAVVYTAGNSDDHHDLYDLAQELPGLLWLHDVRLPGLYLTFARERVGEEAADQFLVDRLLRQYRRRLPLHMTKDSSALPTEWGDWGIGLTKELVDVARGVVVSSSMAERLLHLDQQPDFRLPPTHVVPLAAPAPWGSGLAGREPGLLACFGMVAPVKGPELLISALASLPGATLALVGPVGDGYREHLERHAASLGVADRVVMTGRVDDDGYRSWLARATLALQLRLATNGESSAAVVDCLAAGLPTVTNVAAAAELPAGTVDLLPFDVDAAGLAAHARSLLDSPDRLAALSQGGHRFASSWGFDEVADRLVSLVLSLPPARR